LHNLLAYYQTWLNLENLNNGVYDNSAKHVLYPSSKDMDCFSLFWLQRFFQNLTRRIRENRQEVSFFLFLVQWFGISST